MVDIDDDMVLNISNIIDEQKKYKQKTKLILKIILKIKKCQMKIKNINH